MLKALLFEQKIRGRDTFIMNRNIKLENAHVNKCLFLSFFSLKKGKTLKTPKFAATRHSFVNSTRQLI